MARKKAVENAVKATEVTEAEAIETKTEDIKAEETVAETKAAQEAEAKPKKAPAKKKPAKATKAAEAEAVTEEPAKESPLKTALHVQYAGKSLSEEDLLKSAEDIWIYDLKRSAGELSRIELYVKPEENKVYYVMNEDVEGSFDI